ncbi:MAG: flagella basal body P-ring formation protein FlgA [Bacteroidetes bacterium]|nr:flagella basal body P-ring formation protein FlgA [Bacteroidota bacterium]
MYKNVLVTVRDIKRKEDLAKSDFETSLQNIAGKHAKPFTDIESISSYRSKKNLNVGEILTKNDVEKIIDIIEATGALKYVHDYAKKNVDKAKGYLKKANLNEQGGKFFRDFADYMIKRKI